MTLCAFENLAQSSPSFLLIILEPITFAQRSYLHHPVDTNATTGNSHMIIEREAQMSLAKPTRTWQDRLIFHYTYEQRLESYKCDFHQVWNSISEDTPVMDTRVIIGHRDSRNLQGELVRKRPHPSLLGTITWTIEVIDLLNTTLIVHYYSLSLTVHSTSVLNFDRTWKPSSVHQRVVTHWLLHCTLWSIWWINICPSDESSTEEYEGWCLAHSSDLRIWDSHYMNDHTNYDWYRRFNKNIEKSVIIHPWERTCILFMNYYDIFGLADDTRYWAGNNNHLLLLNGRSYIYT